MLDRALSVDPALSVHYTNASLQFGQITTSNLKELLRTICLNVRLAVAQARRCGSRAHAQTTFRFIVFPAWRL